MVHAEILNPRMVSFPCANQTQTCWLDYPFRLAKHKPAVSDDSRMQASIQKKISVWFLRILTRKPLTQSQKHAYTIFVLLSQFRDEVRLFISIGRGVSNILSFSK
jgi:hypothetical protein